MGLFARTGLVERTDHHAIPNLGLSDSEFDFVPYVVGCWVVNCLVPILGGGLLLLLFRYYL